MCYAIPGKVLQVDGRRAVVDYFGEQRTVLNELDGLRPGDYLYAQGGYAIEIIPGAEALAVLSVWQELFFELQERDLELSRLRLRREGLQRETARLLERASTGSSLGRDELLQLLRLRTAPERELLYQVANFLRRKHLGNSCCVHGILEFSNVCPERCAYCGISALHAGLERRRMSLPEIADAAVAAVERYGFKALVLQSGEDPAYAVADLCGLLREIKRRAAVLIFISTGEVGAAGLEELYAAGARGLLMRFETSNPELYARLHPGNRLETRLEHLRAAYGLGYLIITGGLIGLPGQTDEDVVDDVLLARDLHAEMFSFGPFLPHPQTPLAGSPPPDTDRVLQVLAAARLADPENAKILVTTAFETLEPQARERGLMAGANSVMLNATPDPFKRTYALYPHRAHQDESLPRQIADTLHMLKNLGRAPTDLSVRDTDRQIRQSS